MARFNERVLAALDYYVDRKAPESPSVNGCEPREAIFLFFFPGLYFPAQSLNYLVLRDLPHNIPLPQRIFYPELGYPEGLSLVLNPNHATIVQLNSLKPDEEPRTVDEILVQLWRHSHPRQPEVMKWESLKTETGPTPVKESPLFFQSFFSSSFLVQS